MCEVESVVRGLGILRLVNDFAGSTLARLAAEAGLSRGTTYRMLFTLEAAGFVMRKGDGYYPTHSVRALAHGTDNDWATRIAAPIVRELGRDLLWPITVSEPLAGAAVVRETTDRESPYVFNRTRIGFQMSMIATASGRVMLAYASEQERRGLIEQHAALRQGEVGGPAGGDFDAAAARIRERGYDVLPVPHGRQTAIAVPVLDSQGETVGALAVRYFNSAMTYEQAMDRFLNPLRAGAERISRALPGGAVH